MYHSVQSSQQPAPSTHADRLLYLQNRVADLETLVAQLSEAMASIVGYQIAGVNPVPSSSTRVGP